MFPLCKVLSPTKDLKDQAYAAGSRLGKKTKVPTKQKDTILFEHKWTKECGILLSLSSEATVCIKGAILQPNR